MASDVRLSLTNTYTSTAAVVNVTGYSGISVTVIPGAANTSKVEFSTTPGAAANPSTANWGNWPAGTVSAITTDVFVGPLTALRFTRVSGASADTYEVIA